MPSGRFVRHLLLALLAAGMLHTAPARAQDYTDIWWNPSESGWGVNVVQSDDFLFLTFFIYGQDRKPTWYTAHLTRDGTRYTGPLYLTGGSWFAGSWVPGESTQQVVGNASFQPTNAYTATLTYTVTGLPTVAKAIERQTLTTITLGGEYVGGQSGRYENCTNPSNNVPYIDAYTLQVTQSASRVATLKFDYDSGATCTLSGTLQQIGQVHRISPAGYVCTGTLAVDTQATIFELKQTAQGIEGRFVATLSNGCEENAAFSAVLR